MSVAKENKLVELNENDLDVVVGGAHQHKSSPVFGSPNINVNIDFNIVDIIQIGQKNQVNGNVFFSKK